MSQKHTVNNLAHWRDSSWPYLPRVSSGHGPFPTDPALPPIYQARYILLHFQGHPISISKFYVQ